MAVPARRRPTYAITSVDNALRLIQMLRDLGEIRGKEAADELGISASSVHRLMSMLVFRGFAIQNEARVYLPGPSVGIAPASTEGAKALMEIARPHMLDLRDDLNESSYFMILTGRSIRFLLTAESPHATHAGDRHGFVLPAHASAGGRAVLASKSPEAVAALYENAGDGGTQHDLSDAELELLQAELRTVRQRGYAVSVEEVEKGIVSVAAPIRHAWVRPASAISIAGPVGHRRSITDSNSIDRLLEARDRIEREILALRPSDLI